MTELSSSSAITRTQLAPVDRTHGVEQVGADGGTGRESAARVCSYVASV